MSIEPNRTDYAKFGLMLAKLSPGKIELQAHLILDKKVIAESSPIEVPVDEPAKK